MKRLVVADIHGCFAEFEELLSRANLSPDDEIISLGDMVDRGPATAKVLDFFMNDPRARAVLGNHELRHLLSRDGESYLAFAQLVTRRQLGEAAYRKALDFFDTLPPFIELEEAILAHGFVEPQLPLSQQKRELLAGNQRAEDAMKKRHTSPWYQLYDLQKPLIVGHRDYSGDDKPLIYQDLVFGIETGCCFGKTLTGILLPDFEIIQVKAKTNHWAETKQRYPQFRKKLPSFQEQDWQQMREQMAFLQESAPLLPVEQEYFVGLRETLAWTETAFSSLESYLLQECRVVVARLRRTHKFDELPRAKQVRLFAAQVEGSRATPFLNRLFSGTLSRDFMKNRIKNPLALKRFPFPSSREWGQEFIELQRGLLFHEASGSGPPLVFVHGFSLDSRMWDPQFSFFRKQPYQLVRYDVRGFGRSVPAQERESFHVQDLKTLLKQLRLEQVTLVGFSMGGGIALEFALAFPDMVERLVLVDSSLGGFQWSRAEIMRWVEIAKVVKEEGLNAGKELWLRHPVFKSSMTRPPIEACLREMVCDYSGWHLKNSNPGRLLAPSTIMKLKEIRAPTLVVVGENDVLEMREISELLESEIPDSKRQIVPGAGHLSNMEHPEFFNRTLLEFLKQG